ncbi:hypothetical protein HON58_04790 [Candidatus Peregrinibacteria bacterium]|nr:hypothetical protein [Candidatus Peregrinibacteria bacterium]
MGILQKPDLTCDTCDVLEVCSGTCSGIPVRAKNVTIAVDVVVWVLFATSFFFSFRKRGDGSVDDTSK